MWKWIIYLVIAVWMSFEVLLFNDISPRLGVVGTLVWMLGTALVGLLLMRQQGLQSLIRVFEHLRREELPAREMTNMVLILAGSAMLVLPGFFSDMMGGMLLLSPVRAVILTLFRLNNSGVQVVNTKIIEVSAEHLERDHYPQA